MSAAGAINGRRGYCNSAVKPQSVKMSLTEYPRPDREWVELWGRERERETKRERTTLTFEGYYEMTETWWSSSTLISIFTLTFFPPFVPIIRLMTFLIPFSLSFSLSLQDLLEHMTQAQYIQPWTNWPSCCSRTFLFGETGFTLKWSFSGTPTLLI